MIEFGDEVLIIKFGLHSRLGVRDALHKVIAHNDNRRQQGVEVVVILLRAIQGSGYTFGKQIAANVIDVTL